MTRKRIGQKQEVIEFLREWTDEVTQKPTLVSHGKTYEGVRKGNKVTFEIPGTDRVTNDAFEYCLTHGSSFPIEIGKRTVVVKVAGYRRRPWYAMFPKTYVWRLEIIGVFP